MSKPTTPILTRRKALAGAGAAGALAAAAVALPCADQAPQQKAEDKQAPEQGGGYQVTQHVLRYYETTKV